ncbi:MAG: heparinase II/III family protein [Tannerella sp.]|jgi:hypothetical protein|nr:heparinase II/III family protein [Tannerella sp.]
MKKIILLLLCSPFVYCDEGWDIVTANDRISIKAAAQTEWGQRIVDSLQNIVAKRRRHPLRVPLLEGGHLHQYFCPVHNVMFKWDWNSPDSHYCNLCRKSYDNEPRYQWAWINLLHRENLKYLTASMYLYIVTEDTLYAGYIRDMALDYAAKYHTYMIHNTGRVANAKQGGRMFAQSLEEGVWAAEACRAFTVAETIMTDDQKEKLRRGYLKPCADLLLNSRVGGNWQVWHNSGLLALGVALRDDSIINTALNDPACGYYTMMKRNVYHDGWWSEGSPVYHFYPLQAMIFSADAMRCRGIDLYDDKLYNMLAAPALAVYDDLSLPAHNDGWYGESLAEQTQLYEFACARFKENTPFKDVLSLCYRQTERLSPEALLNITDIKPAETLNSPPSTLFPELGVAFLRNGKQTVTLKYGPHGGGHGHPDKLSITLHNGRKELVTDLGTSAYGVPDYTQWFRKTLSHSTVTVDAKDQNPTTGRLLNFKPQKNGGIVSATVSDAYPGVEMTRTVMLKNNRLTDEFSAVSDTVHQYDYVLIFNTQPVIKDATLIDTTLNDAPVYKRISGVKQASIRKQLQISFPDGSIFKITPDGVYQIFIGEAPGVPNRIGSHNEYQKSFPLIIRMKTNRMKITSEILLL